MSTNKILIIDDEFWSIEPAIDRIKHAFGEDSFTYCSDAAEGLYQLSRENYCCIILDIMFPLGGDLETNDDTSDSIKAGIIVLNRIRNDLKMMIPIICFTIRDDDEIRKDIGFYKHTFHISKINSKAQDLLINQLRKHIKK